ncbi:MAG: PEP-CTERM sorting domain-containing protein [Phycisphaerae bacterium]
MTALVTGGDSPGDHYYEPVMAQGQSGRFVLCSDVGSVTASVEGRQVTGTGADAGLWAANAYTGGTLTPRMPDLVGGPHASGLTAFNAADLYMDPRGECPVVSLRTWTPDGYAYPDFDVLLVSGARTADLEDVRLSYGPLEGPQPPLVSVATGLDRQPVTELGPGQVYAVLVPSAWDGRLDIQYTIGATLFRLDHYRPPLNGDLALQYWDIDVGGYYEPYVHSQGDLKARTLVVRRSGQFQVTNGAYVYAWDTGFLDGSMIEVTGSGSRLDCYDSTYLGGALTVADGGQVSVGLGRQLVIGADGGGLSGGGGTVQGDVFNHGLVRYSLHVEGNYEQADSGNLVIFVRDAPSEAGACDLLEVRGDAVLGGTLTLNFLSFQDPHPGDVYTFLTAGGFRGGFDALEVLYLDPGLAVAYDMHGGQFSIVPEPTTLGLLVLGGLGLLARRRRT